MSIQLKELIERIKREGVGEAEQQASQIIKTAEEEARAIVDKAQEQARSVTEKAEADARRFEEASREAIRQAGRDLVLQTEQEIKRLFRSLLNREIGKTMDETLLKEAILTLIKAWGEKSGEELVIEVPEQSVKAVQNYLIDQAAGAFQAGVEIHPSDRLEKGFRVSQKDGSAFYDFSDVGLTDFLLEYLNPKVSEILRETSST